MKKVRIIVPGQKKKPGMSKTVDPILIIGGKTTLGMPLQKFVNNAQLILKSYQKKSLIYVTKNLLVMLSTFISHGQSLTQTVYVLIDKAETEAELCFAMNATGPATLAKICYDKGIKFMTFSSDMVFDGLKRSPYFENDIVKPLNIIWQSKAFGEKKICADSPSSLIIRSGAFFSPWDDSNFATHILKTLMANENMPVLEDVHISPAYIPDLV
jgi:dTDP-4-dehydrorhamnose reductase